jgi:hypothetical protein
MSGTTIYRTLDPGDAWPGTTAHRAGHEQERANGHAKAIDAWTELNNQRGTLRAIYQLDHAAEAAHRAGARGDYHQAVPTQALAQALLPGGRHPCRCAACSSARL